MVRDPNPSPSPNPNPNPNPDPNPNQARNLYRSLGYRVVAIDRHAEVDEVLRGARGALAALAGVGVGARVRVRVRIGLGLGLGSGLSAWARLAPNP